MLAEYSEESMPAREKIPLRSEIRRVSTEEERSCIAFRVLVGVACHYWEDYGQSRISMTSRISLLFLFLEFDVIDGRTFLAFDLPLF